jgi:AAA domain
VHDDKLRDMSPSLDERACNLRVVSLVGLKTAHIPEQAYAVAGWLPYRLVTLLSGHGGAGKSMLALIIAAHYACGKQWAGIDIEQGPALYVSLEDSGNVVMLRLRRICHVYQLDFAQVERNLTIVDGSDSEGALFIESRYEGTTTILHTELWSEFQSIAAGHRLIVIDNSSDAFSGNENDRRQVRAFLRQLAGIARENNAAVMLLAHIDKAAARDATKGNGQNFSGSTAWHNSARSRIALLSEGDTVTMAHEKLNGGLRAESIALQWQATDGVLIPLRTENVDGFQFTQNEQDDADVVAIINAANAIGHDIKTSRNGCLTGWHTIQTIECTPKWARASGSKQRFWDAINRLLKAGKIGQVTYRHKGERKDKHRFEVRQ